MLELAFDHEACLARLIQYQERWRTLAYPLRNTARIVSESIRANYATHGQGAWPPRKVAYPWQPLRRTGAMYHAQLTALSGMVTQSASETTIDFSPAIFATPYSIYHHAGTRKMPARQTVYLTTEYQQQITDLLADYILIK